VALNAVSISLSHVAREIHPLSIILPKLLGTDRPANNLNWEIYPFVC